MARRRMFSLDVVETDRFMDMPTSAQALYFHLGLHGDDEGFVSSPKSDDSNAMMLQRLIYATKDLRNAIAHNDVIFDTRFRTGDIDKQVCSAISNATSVHGLTFETITDYLVLVVYQLSLLRISKNEIKRLISSFVECTEKLRKAIPTSVYNQIIRTDNNAKINALRKFI